MDYHKFRSTAAPGGVTTIVTHSKLPPRVAHPRAFRSINISHKQSCTTLSTKQSHISTSTEDICQLIATANSSFHPRQHSPFRKVAATNKVTSSQESVSPSKEITYISLLHPGIAFHTR